MTLLNRNKAVLSRNSPNDDRISGKITFTLQEERNQYGINVSSQPSAVNY